MSSINEHVLILDSSFLLEPQQADLFGEKNTARVKQQKNAEIFVIIGNPPYNVGQVNENDNNKNRKYGEIERSIKETYAKASKAM
jgi:predicted helicase